MGELVCGLRYILARDPQGVRRIYPVASLTSLATHQFALPRNKTGEVSALVRIARTNSVRLHTGLVQNDEITARASKTALATPTFTTGFADGVTL